MYLPRAVSIEAGSALIEIVGKDAAGLAGARAEIITIVRALPPAIFAVVEIDSLIHRHLIGKKGNKIKAFEEKRSVEVVFPPDGEDRSDILLVYSGEGSAEEVLAGSSLPARVPDFRSPLSHLQKSAPRSSSSPRRPPTSNPSRSPFPKLSTAPSSGKVERLSTLSLARRSSSTSRLAPSLARESRKARRPSREMTWWLFVDRRKRLRGCRRRLGALRRRLRTRRLSTYTCVSLALCEDEADTGLMQTVEFEIDAVHVRHVCALPRCPEGFR